MNNGFNSFQNYSWKGIIFIQEVYNTVKVNKIKLYILILLDEPKKYFWKSKDKEEMSNDAFIQNILR